MAEEGDTGRTRRKIDVTIRYLPQCVNYDDPMPESTYRRIERSLALDLDLCALVIVDVWNTECVSGDRLNEITRSRIKPVVDACRAAGIEVIHAPSPAVAAKYPGHRYRPRRSASRLHLPLLTEAFVDPSYARGAWPTADMRMRTGDFRECSLRVAPGARYLSREELYRNYRINPDVGPLAREAVIADREELHALLTAKRRFHLFYAGFVSNGCIQQRDYGMKYMGLLGYNPILLRDCTTAMEMEHSLPDLEQSRATIDTIECWACTTTSESLLSSLRRFRGREEAKA